MNLKKYLKNHRSNKAQAALEYFILFAVVLALGLVSVNNFIPKVRESIYGSEAKPGYFKNVADKIINAGGELSPIAPDDIMTPPTPGIVPLPPEPPPKPKPPLPPPILPPLPPGTSSIKYQELLLNGEHGSNNWYLQIRRAYGMLFYKFTIPYYLPGSTKEIEIGGFQIWDAYWNPFAMRGNSDMLLSATDFGSAANAQKVYRDYIADGGYQKAKSTLEINGATYWARTSSHEDSEHISIQGEDWVAGKTFYLMIIAPQGDSGFRLGVYLAPHIKQVDYPRDPVPIEFR